MLDWYFGTSEHNEERPIVKVDEQKVQPAMSKNTKPNKALVKKQHKLRLVRLTNMANIIEERKKNKMQTILYILEQNRLKCLAEVESQKEKKK